MFCKNCGKQIEPNSKFCQYCGQNLNDINTNINNNVMMSNYTSNMNYNNSVSSQQMTNNYNNIPTMPNNTPQQKSDNPILIMMIVVFLILAVAIPIVVYLVSGNEDSSLEKESSKEDVVEPEYPNIEQPDTPVYPDIEEPDIPSNDNSSTKVINHSGYNYTIPSNYMFEYYEENLIVYDNSAEWFLMFATAEYPYSTYSQNIDVIDNGLSAEYGNVITEIKKYQNVEYIETDMTAEGMSVRMLYFSVDKDTTALVMLMPTVETVSLDSLFKIAFPIVESIEEDSKHVL